MAESFNVSFYTRKEASKIGLSDQEIRFIGFVRKFQSGCWILCILMPLALAGYSFYAIFTPQWKITMGELQAAKSQFEAYSVQRKLYANAVNQLNQRLRMDLIATPLLTPRSEAIFLESVQFKTIYDDFKATGTFSVEGISSQPGEDVVKSYILSLKDKLQDEFPDWKVSLSLRKSFPDPDSGGLHFSFVGTLSQGDES